MQDFQKQGVSAVKACRLARFTIGNANGGLTNLATLFVNCVQVTDKALFRPACLVKLQRGSELFVFFPFLMRYAST